MQENRAFFCGTKDYIASEELQNSIVPKYYESPCFRNTLIGWDIKYKY